MKIERHKPKGHPVTPILGIGIGVGMSVLLSLLLSALTAWFVNGGQLPQNAIYAATVPIQMIATFVGCVTAMLLIGNMPAVIVAGCVGIYFAILVSMNILTMNSSLGGVGKGFASILGGAVLALAINLLSKGKTKRRKTRVR